jgi:hypothetical protein
MTAMDEEFERIVALLERSVPLQKLDLIDSVLERFGLYAKAIAREPQASAMRTKQMQGAIEIFVRCFDQRRDYSADPVDGRPDEVFIEMLLDLGEAYDLSEYVRLSLLHAAEKIKGEGLVN